MGSYAGNSGGSVRWLIHGSPLIFQISELITYGTCFCDKIIQAVIGADQPSKIYSCRNPISHMKRNEALL